MVSAYVLRLALVWGTLPLAVLGGSACLAAGIALAVLRGVDFWPVRLLVGAAAVLFLYRLWYGRRGATARVLSGGFPCAWLCGGGGGGGPAPRNEQELHETIRRLMPTRDCPTPSVVGAGWGWWTRRVNAPRKRLFTHRLVGRPDVEGDPFCFWAGTSIYELTQTLLDDRCCWQYDESTGTFRPLTPWSHPSISNISLGGWFGPSAHGNRGDSGRGSSHALRLDDGIEVWNMRDVADGRPARIYKRRVGYKKLRHMMDEEGGADEYIVVRVYLDPNRLSYNTMLQTQLVVVKDEKSAAEYLNIGRILGVLFVGSGREGALGLRYQKVYDDGTTRPLITACPCLPFEQQHIDPHDCGCSRNCRSAQLDTCSFIGGWYERSLNAWRGRSTLRDANLFTPLYLPPIVMLTAPCIGIYNFEVVCRLPHGQLMTGEWLYRLVCLLRQEFSCTRGRAEVRNGKANGVLFIDMGTTPQGFAIPFRVLRSLGINEVALHNSKYEGKDLRCAAQRMGVSLVSPYRVYYGP